MDKKTKKLYSVFIAIVICVAIIVGLSVYYGTKSSQSGSSGQVKVIMSSILKRYHRSYNYLWLGEPGGSQKL